MIFSPLPSIRLACRFLGYWNSECPARAAERAPEAPEVVGRRGSGPGAAVVVAVNTAGDGLAVLRAGGVRAKAAHRRPIRHCRRRRRVEARGAAPGLDESAPGDRPLCNGTRQLTSS